MISVQSIPVTSKTFSKCRVEGKNTRGLKWYTAGMSGIAVLCLVHNPLCMGLRTWLSMREVANGLPWETGTTTQV